MSERTFANVVHYLCAGGAMLEAFCLGSVIVDGPAWRASVYTIWLILFLRWANEAQVEALQALRPAAPHTEGTATFRVWHHPSCDVATSGECPECGHAWAAHQPIQGGLIVCAACVGFPDICHRSPTSATAPGGG